MVEPVSPQRRTMISDCVGVKMRHQILLLTLFLGGLAIAQDFSDRVILPPVQPANVGVVVDEVTIDFDGKAKPLPLEIATDAPGVLKGPRSTMQIAPINGIANVNVVIRPPKGVSVGQYRLIPLKVQDGARVGVDAKSPVIIFVPIEQGVFMTSLNNLGKGEYALAAIGGKGAFTFGVR